MDLTSQQKIRQDFDRIADLSKIGWDHNSHYHRYLLSHLPQHCTMALDIGCGSGAFSRLLAERSERVLSLDLSPKMLDAARKQSSDQPNIEYHCADAIAWDYPPDYYDCIVSIATLHHMPARDILMKMKGALKPGGVLLILDLIQDESLSDTLWQFAAVPANILLRVIKYHRLSEPPELRRAWEEHGRDEQYLTLSQVRTICSDMLAGAKIRRHLLWRYSIIWKKEENC